MFQEAQINRFEELSLPSKKEVLGLTSELRDLINQN